WLKRSTQGLAIHPGLPRRRRATHAIEGVGQSEQPAGNPAIVLEPSHPPQFGGWNIAADRQRRAHSFSPGKGKQRRSQPSLFYKPGESKFRRLGIRAVRSTSTASAISSPTRSGGRAAG